MTSNDTSAKPPTHRSACMLLLLIFASTIQSFAAENERLNIVLVLADDLAWSDLGCYGHPWHDTPHLDRLASEGIRFTNAYAAAPICSASRAALMTGKTTARLHFEFVTKEVAGLQQLDAPTPLQAPPFTLNLPLEETTIGEILAAGGYETAFFGKWHLNAHHNRYLGWSPLFGPQRQGFQVAIEDFGSHPYSWGKTKPKPIKTPGKFPDDSMIDRCVELIHQPHPQPFFLFASQFYVHTPVKTPCQWLLSKYDERVPQATPNRQQRVTYAAFVEELDQRVGRLLDAIDEAQLRDQTVVIFTSDNGGHPQYTANAPWRGSKWNLYEGGIRAPLLIRLPHPARSATVCDLPVVGYDLLPTIAELAHVKLTEKTIDGHSFYRQLLGEPAEPTEPAKSRSLLWHFPYYHPETGYRTARDTIGINDFTVSKTQPHSALRVDRHKVLYFYEDERVELYDLENDPSEQHDLSTRQPALAHQLRDRLLTELQSVHARFPQ